MHYKIVLDCETGGFDCNEHPITEIAYSVYDWKKYALIESYQSFIKPYNDLTITDEALNASNVTMKQINSGISDTELMKQLITTFTKYKMGHDLPVIVGHNTGFDMGFLESLFNYRNKNLYDFISRVTYDTCIMMKDYEGGVKNADKQRYKLGICCERLGIKLKSAHGAAADVAATADLFKILMNKMRSNSSNNNNSDEQSGITKSRNFFELEFKINDKQYKNYKSK